MLAVLICEKFGWTYQEYESQPVWFIDLITMKMEAEAMFGNKDGKKQ